MLLSGVKRRAKKYGASDLDIEWFLQKFHEGCALTGLPFSIGEIGRGRDAFAPSIDRIDVKQGYMRDNCRLILHVLNVAFNSWGEEPTRKAFAAYLARSGVLKS